MNIYDVEKMLATEYKKEPESFTAGSIVKVHYKIKEREKERIHPIDGVVLKQQGTGFKKTFTIRRISYGSGMEITFPLYSPHIEKIEIVKPPKKRARRARLYFMRNRLGKEATAA